MVSGADVIGIRGFNASASLKPTPAARQVDLLTARIRGFNASASLKLGRASASASASACTGIRGFNASASLKPGSVPCGGVVFPGIRGFNASASLKRRQDERQGLCAGWYPRL